MSAHDNEKLGGGGGNRPSFANVASFWIATVCLLFINSIWIGWRGVSKPSDTLINVGGSPEGVVDFGEVDGSLHATEVCLPILNAGSRDVSVDFAVSCECTSVLPQTIVVGAGDETRATIVLDVRRVLAASAGDSVVVPVSLQVIGRVRETGEILTWRLTGRITRSLLCSPPSVEFEVDSSKSVDEIRDRIVTVQATEPLERVIVSRFGSGIDAHVRKRSPTWFEIHLSAGPLAATGMHRCSFSIVGVRSNETVTAACVIGAAVQIRNDWHCSPELLTLGGLAAGARESQNIAIRSLSGTPFSVGEPVCECGGAIHLEVAREGAAQDPQAEFQFRVGLEAVRPGVGRAVLRFPIQSGERTGEVVLLIVYSFVDSVDSR